MKYHSFPASDGEDFQIEDLEHLQDAFTEAINGLASMCGDPSYPYVIYGVIDNGTTVSAGWIYYDGELYRFKSSASSSTIVIRNEEIEAGTGDYEKWMECGTGVSTINFASLKRLNSLYDFMYAVKSKIHKTGTEAYLEGSESTINMTVEPESFYTSNEIHGVIHNVLYIKASAVNTSTNFLQTRTNYAYRMPDDRRVWGKAKSGNFTFDVMLEVVGNTPDTFVISKSDGSDFEYSTYDIYFEFNHIK